MATRMSESPAPVQITVDQILHEARKISRQEEEIKYKVTDLSEFKITDSSELSDYRLRRRNRFEEQIRRKLPRCDIKVWIKYALWEDSQKEYDRARSVFERALEAGFRCPLVWIKYAEMEMENNFIDSARNVWDRAVKCLPRVDNLWVKYILMEKDLENIAGAGQIFERWMNLSYDPLEEINVEERCFKKQKVEG